jgi:hypothetical protein
VLKISLKRMLSLSSDCVRRALDEEEETERRGGKVGVDAVWDCTGSEIVSAFEKNLSSVMSSF